ncbi:FAD-dependent oxidoreductase [Erwinia psidii]|uniref:NAD(P)/FAD-dependent oxidoreductase n=1 Tax=Erwinia psidii TaxID=69224 RepID=UPI00226BA2D3|nr:FAD-dependent oxidoreductase [Erwinia psidii]MCX8957301.1 FAD-dependent oxidoreductase [Erwinia psidii]MCX8959671.1 FAD-dependent oxidoreductase [Erwinia psidii]MCX8964614.1 FAD-dependent oxidoreductase [Erwinia psidii]
MKIAIIGSGIAGLSCAWKLASRADVHLFEADARLGGHTATVDVDVDGHSYAIDTGFIVFNDRTYPHFRALLAELGLEGQPTEMSFSVRNVESGLEYNGHSLNSLFAQRSNLLRPHFWRFLANIMRFNRRAKQWLQQPESPHAHQHTLENFLQTECFNSFFTDHYILPMGAAIWSCSLSEIRQMPLTLFLRFFDHHGLLDITHRPQWYVIPGGSREYIRRLMARIDDRLTVNLSTPVLRVERHASGVTLHSTAGSDTFDQVIFACHSDRTLELLSDATDEERQMLTGVLWSASEVVLHTDTRLLPENPRAWASWNYHLDTAQPECGHAGATVTYNMNRLQGLDAPTTFCVTLNATPLIDADKILGRYVFHHPQFGLQSLLAQRTRLLLNGVNRSWYCGAWCYNGFHEDGIRSALDVVAGMERAGLL